jgi:hypothetical protein
MAEDQVQTQPSPAQPRDRLAPLKALLSQQGQRSSHGSGISPQAARTATGDRVWCQHPNCKGTTTNPARWLMQPKSGKALLTCTTHKRVIEKAGGKALNSIQP